jgi:protein-tyrosine-phosphatase
MPSVLFVCVANSFRSQMAEALAKAADPSWEVWSAGSNPGGHVHPMAERLMKEVGLSLAGHRSKGLGEVPARRWDYVVTMGCGDACPHVPAQERLDWALPDPAAGSDDAARRIRDEIAAKIKDLMARHGQPSR